MALGKVQVNNLNLKQGAFDDVERYFLFLGVGAANIGTVVYLSAESDLDTEIGAADSDLKTQLIAAQVNGGQNWAAACVPLADAADWEDAYDLAMEEDVRAEAVVICAPVAAKADVDAFHTKAMSTISTYGRRLFFILSARGVDDVNETWAQYIAAVNDLTDDVAADRVCIVPQLHGNNLGVLAGRLCNRAVSIADSPMRVATGPLLGLGDVPVDNADVPLQLAHLIALDNARFSVPQTYADYPGVYWGDGNMLDIPAGDYQVIENLRVADKAARAIRVLAIARIADRSLNSSSISIESNKTYFMRPLHEMSRSVVFAGQHFPAEIKPPEDDAIEIVWKSQTSVEIYLKLTPWESPKEITANILLDLNDYSAEV